MIKLNANNEKHRVVAKALVGSDCYRISKHFKSKKNFFMGFTLDGYFSIDHKTKSYDGYRYSAWNDEILIPYEPAVLDPRLLIETEIGIVVRDYDGEETFGFISGMRHMGEDFYNLTLIDPEGFDHDFEEVSLSQLRIPKQWLIENDMWQEEE